MNRVILTTVGTSLLGNAKRENLYGDETIHAYLARDPYKASAETNSLNRLLETGDRIELLHSDTQDGRWCAETIGKYLRSKGFTVDLFAIEGLAYEAKGFIDYGLRNFVQLLAGRVRNAQRSGREAIINATGGFKAEIAYATALGLVFKTRVCYIHERFGEIVTLPPSPFGWDNSLIAWNSEFFDWIDAELRPTPEVNQRASQLNPEARLLLEDMPDGYTVLSPLGQAYLEAFRGELDQAQTIPIYLSRKAQRDWEGYDPTTQDKYRNVLKRLRLPNRASQSELKSGGGDGLGYPKGHTAERVFYAEQGGELYVFELTRHGGGYEELCSRGVRWRDHPKDQFTLWED